MRAVIQRVKNASVVIEEKLFSEIGNGLLILLGIEAEDNQGDIDWLVSKVVKMRIFSDENDAMNLSVLDVGGEILLVSQFTLHASTKKGNRPSYIKAARPEIAIPLYENCIDTFNKEFSKPIKTGTFGAMMEITIVNDGPVTITIDTKNRE